MPYEIVDFELRQVFCRQERRQQQYQTTMRYNADNHELFSVFQMIVVLSPSLPYITPLLLFLLDGRNFSSD